MRARGFETYVLSIFLTRTAQSDFSSHQTRPLSCATLVAYSDTTITRGRTTGNTAGCLSLVDVTGAYRVRAHCMGGGLIMTAAKAGDKGESETSLVSDAVNCKLLELWKKEQLSGKARHPYFDVTSDEGLQTLLEILSTSKHEGNVSQSPHVGPLLKKGTRLELATIDVRQRKMVRKLVVDVWGNNRKVC
jgi:hypothetical protein